MIVHNFKWKDYLFTRNPGESFNNRILLQKVDIKPVKTEVNKLRPAFRHGIISGYTLIRERLINVEGIIIADDEATRDNLIKNLDNLFLPAIDFGVDNDGKDKFYFTDLNGNNYYITCKPIELPEYNEEQGTKNLIWFKLTLLADDPFIYGVDVMSVNDINRTQGLLLDTTLDATFGYNSYLTINYQGAIQAPLYTKIEAITDNATDGYVRIRNLTSGKLFKIAVNMDSGDVLEVDTKNSIAKLNGVDISSAIEVISDWIYLNQGDNNLVVDTGKDYHTANITYQYQNLWI